MDDYEEYYDGEEPYMIVEHRTAGVGTFLLGALLGAGAAMLLAPQSGPETRRRITRTAQRATDAARDLVEEISSSVGDTIEQTRDSVELKKRQVSNAVDAGRAAARQAREELEFRIAESKAAYKDR